MSLRTLRFGLDSLEVYFDPKRLAGSFQGPSNRETDVSAAVREGLLTPIDAPPFARAFAPGDKVVIAFDSNIDEPDLILQPILDSLASAGVEAADVTVVCSAGRDEKAIDTEAFAARFAEGRRPGQIVAHNPDDPAATAYLASSKDGKRIYLARPLIDADATLTVSLAGHDAVLGHAGSAGGLYPALSNTEAIERSRAVVLEGYRDPASMRARQLCDEVGWLLGTFYSINVSVNREGAIDRVWVGQVAATQKASNDYFAEHWTVNAGTEPIDLVVAVAAPSSQRSRWSDVAAALDSAANLAPAGADILLISDVEEPLGATGAWLVDSDNPWQILARLQQSRESDIVATSQLARGLSHHKVYFYSRMPVELVESLSMVGVATPKEVQKLVSARKRVFLLEQANQVAVRKAKNASRTAEIR